MMIFAHFAQMLLAKGTIGPGKAVHAQNSQVTIRPGIHMSLTCQEHGLNLVVDFVTPRRNNDGVHYDVKGSFLRDDEVVPFDGTATWDSSLLVWNIDSGQSVWIHLYEE